MRARTEVFLAALDLHRACIEANAREVRDTLVELCRLLTRDPGRTTVKEAERAAWQTLFLLIPVLSTTFASTGRMFGPLGKEELGWLLIDEAGQALPQAAVGALWRAKRAVVVGDPRQLEPISQLPGQVQRELANSFGIAQTSSPPAVPRRPWPTVAADSAHRYRRTPTPFGSACRYAYTAAARRPCSR